MEIGNKHIEEDDDNTYIREHLLSLIGEGSKMSVETALKVAEKIEEMSTNHKKIDMDNINLYCSLFENNQMSVPQNREAGNILLQPLLDNNLGFMRDRCISAYIISVRDDKKALSQFEEILKNNSNADKYCDYITRIKKQSTLDMRRDYLKNKNMLFITTNIIDIDGTLDYGKEPCKTENKIGGRQKFNQQLIKMITEHPEDDFAICTRRIYSTRDRLKVCADLIENCRQFLEDEPENECIEKFMRLLQRGKLKAYSKRDLMNNEHICIAGSITDDEMPEILGIQSLSDATISTYRSCPELDKALQPLWNDVPADRKMTLQQFEDEKMLSARMEYLQNSEMNFITTELIDQDALLTPSGELDINSVNLLLNKEDDWAIVYYFNNKITKLLDEKVNDKILCKFKTVLEEKNKLINETIFRGKNNICLVKPRIYSRGLSKINSLTDEALSVMSEPTQMDPRIKKAYEEIPAERKMTIKQYLDMQQQTSELEISPAIHGALERVQTQKQKLDDKREKTTEIKRDADKAKNNVVPNHKRVVHSPYDVKDIKNIKDNLIK